MGTRVSLPAATDLAAPGFNWNMPPSDWMTALAAHYDRIRRQYPKDRLVVVFDIDGTILDMRHMVRWMLLAYDRAHGTDHFRGLQPESITSHENHVDEFLRSWPLAGDEREKVLAWYSNFAWSDDAILASHQPFRGVLDVIRWFQIQPLVDVGLNTGRPESYRQITLRSLNAVGAEYRVEFPGELLFMSPRVGNQHVPAAKAEGIRYFQQLGYRVVAMIDNEPVNIESMAASDETGEILFLHADTIFESKRTETPRTVRGRFYDITNLVARDQMPKHVELVWHEVNSPVALEQFLNSNVRWGEVDVRHDPVGRLVVRGKCFERSPWTRDERPLLLEDHLTRFRRHGKAIKLDLEGGADLLDEVNELLETAGAEDDGLWFNANVPALGSEGFRRLAEAYPRAVIQCPVDFLVPLIQTMPDKAREVLDELSGWGINRFSLSWRSEGIRQALGELEAWGFEVNIYDVPNLEAFLQAALLLPRSMTSDFSFSKWSV